MTSSIPLKIEFVDLSRPGQKPTVRSSQRANSHAAREAIARARRLRVQEYQASQAKRQCIEHDDAKIRNKTRSEWKLSSLNNEQSFPYPEESSKMLIPNPATLLPADRKDPFASFAAPLNPMEHFLLDHYVKAVLPYLTTHCTIIGHQSIRHTDMVGEWVPLALTDAGLLSGIFLAACRHLCLYSHSNAHVAEMAVNYKLICLRELGNAITTFSARSKNRDTAVAKAMTLALDELMNTGRTIVEVWTSPCILSSFFFHFITIHFEELTMSANGDKTTIPLGSWVLVTGATGYVAAHIIKQLLERGYKVRGTVRDQSRASWLTTSPAFKPYAERGDFTLATVPDLAAPHAFDDAVRGVSSVIHVASVVTFSSDPNEVIPPTVAGTTSVLEAALGEPGVRTFVYTSSIVAAVEATGSGDGALRAGRDTWNDGATAIAWAPPPYEPGRGSFVYRASKVAAEKAVWKFRDERKPHFTVNSVLPSMVIGEPLDRSHAESKSNWIRWLYDGNVAGTASIPATWCVDVKDTAVLHVAAALDPEVKDARIQAWGHSSSWKQLLSITRNFRPEKELPTDLPGVTGAVPTADFSQVLALLKKWGGQDSWTPLEDTVADNIEGIEYWNSVN
ncbi:hypothetical protein BX600DRAFT_482486 [Xylariales sp. PMI_506]|nr:hypothetical protein BX600DRAFT_482486 [Xylariales sp. PMI_506]